MSAGLVRSFSIYVDASTAGTQAFAGKAVFNESNNPQGGNTQITDLTASVIVDATSCTSLKTFVAPGQAKQLTLGLSCGSLSTQGGLIIPARADGNIVVLGDAGLATGCGKNTPCIGDMITASVNSGATITPYLTWTVFYSNATLGTTKPDRVSFLHDTTLIKSIKNGGACTTPTQVDCQDPFQVGADGVTFFIRTATNSTVRGL
jgi:hypothetical protein